MLGKILFEMSETMYENRENWQVRIKMKKKIERRGYAQRVKNTALKLFLKLSGKYLERISPTETCNDNA